MDFSTAFSLSDWLEQGVILSQGNGKILLGWGTLQWIPKPHADQISFYFPDFFLENSSPWLVPAQCCSIAATDLLSQLEHTELPCETIEPILWELPDKTRFSQAFYELQKLFLTTPLEKAVLYGCSRSAQQITAAHRKQALIKILQDSLAFPLHVYGFWKGSQEGILGATPEVLFRHDSNASGRLYTMALAGTQKNNKAVLSMMKNPKLLHEHGVVVEDIRSRLALLGAVSMEKLQILQLPLLSHLYTPLSVQLSTTPPFDKLVNALHPTPALGGFPRQAAVNWLKKFNTHLPRGRFGAPVGCLNPHLNEYKCYVAIRNITWDRQGITMGAGCGIVAQSHFETEWEEFLLKTQSIKRLFF